MKNAAFRWLMTEPGQTMVKEDFDPFSPDAGEVVVEVAGCGVCHTDLGYFYDGVRTTHPLPLALGHEISGHVVAAGAGAEDWVGKPVLVPSVVPCGTCDLCKRGKETICRDQVMPGYDIQGGFGSHIKISSFGLCEVDLARLAAAGLELADISVVADAVTTPYQAVLQAGVEPGCLAVVIGVGGIGGNCVQVANHFGATVVAVDVDTDRLARLSDHGAALTIDAREVRGRDLKKAIGAFAKERGLPATEWIIFECSGSAPGQASAYGCLVHGATLCVVGFTMDKVEVRLSNLMAFHARALGNWGCPPRYYPDALDLVLDQKIEIKSFIEHHPMDDINQVFEAVHARKNQGRPILLPA
jgi:6-hydroxycyclohex-1-ene-1-carbonyl-CoA dehydrogenase